MSSLRRGRKRSHVALVRARSISKKHPITMSDVFRYVDRFGAYPNIGILKLVRLGINMTWVIKASKGAYGLENKRHIFDLVEGGKVSFGSLDLGLEKKIKIRYLRMEEI